MAIEHLAEERLAIYHALLGSAASLSRGEDPSAILRGACDALVEASPHIRLAWMYLGDPDAPLIRPAYAVGPARDYARDLLLDRSPAVLAGPTRQAISRGIPVLSHVRGNPAFDPWRDKALRYGLEASLSFPFGAPRGAMRGVGVVYVDIDTYFEQVGLEPFSAFAHLAAAAVEQADLRLHLTKSATIDSLTGLLRRGAIREIIGREHGRCIRHERCYSLLLIDLDRFKLINDSYGHSCGDDLLVAVARAGSAVLRQGDWLGRWGGEEFLALLPETGAIEACAIAERLRGCIAEVAVPAGGDTVSTTASIGVASWSRVCDSPEQVLMQADVALYEAKKSGRDRVVGADGETNTVSVAVQLNVALAADRVLPVYQPIVELATGRQVADEALARLVLPDGSLVAAGQFINAAVELQMAHKVDFRILSDVIQRCAGRIKCGRAPMAHFVNASIDLLRHRELVQGLLSQVVSACQGIHDYVEQHKPMVIEITEREFLDDVQLARKILSPLLDFGFRLAIDDFGCGYSSFRYLADLPVSFLKIEGELVRRAATEGRIRRIVHGIHDIAADLGVITVAEYVEDEATVEVLREIGVDWAQGYYFGRAEIDPDTCPPALKQSLTTPA